MEKARFRPPLTPLFSMINSASDGSWEAADERAEVVAGVRVVARGRAAPLCELAEAAFDHVASPVAGRVEPGGSSGDRTTPAPVGLLITGLGDGVGDAASAQQFPVRPGTAALVGPHVIRSRAWPPAGRGEPPADRP
jgi:hypothetical protein